MNMEDQTTQATDEQRFIRDALAGAEKAERLQKIKLIVVTLIAFGGCYYAFDRPVAPEHTAGSVVLVVGLMLMVCLAKILASNTRNTRLILQALSERSRR